MTHNQNTPYVGLNQTPYTSDLELHTQDSSYATIPTRFTDMNSVIVRAPPTELPGPFLLDIEDHDVPGQPAECEHCQMRQEAHDVRIDELRASMMLAQRLKAIESIGWSSIFGTSPYRKGVDVPPRMSKIGDWVSARTIWVKRCDGVVCVRERPWTVGVT
jgi:hypothetical protein